MVGNCGGHQRVLEIAGDGRNNLVTVRREQVMRVWCQLKERAAEIVIDVIKSGVFALKHRMSVRKVELESRGRILGVYYGCRGRKLLCLRHFGL